MNRVCMVCIKDERSRAYSLCEVVAMFETTEDLLSFSAMFVPSCTPNKTLSL